MIPVRVAWQGVASGCVAVLLVALPALAQAQIAVSPSGHYVQYGGQTLLVVGDSGTQCVTQNAHVDYRSWIDDCAARGIRMVHVWSFVPPRQKQDGSEIEARWGYVYPGITPWARSTGGPPARDQLPRWDLQRFDDGSDAALDRYWPRMRDLCGYAREKGLLVGITVFTGWAKHQADWLFHPLHVDNGGHLEQVKDAVLIATPDREVLNEAWSEEWPKPRKTQWVWERLAHELIAQLNPFGNVFFVFLDEHSYDAGNLGGHFLEFFKGRGAVWMDWTQRRDQVDFVISGTSGREDKHAIALKGFRAEPVRPYFLLEGGPYRGGGVRTSMWSFSMGGGHFTFHADEEQETVRTGIMGYDPHAPGADKGMLKRDWLGHLSRFFNEHVRHLDDLSPHNDLVDNETYCLASPGVEYVVYARRGGPMTFQVDLSGNSGKPFVGRFYDPGSGVFSEDFQVERDGNREFRKTNAEDWVLHLVQDEATAE